MVFNLEDTNAVEDIRHNEETECDEYLFRGEWYEKEDLIDHLMGLDLTTIEKARGRISLDKLPLHFPADIYRIALEEEKAQRRPRSRK